MEIYWFLKKLLTQKRVGKISRKNLFLSLFSCSATWNHTHTFNVFWKNSNIMIVVRLWLCTIISKSEFQVGTMMKKITIIDHIWTVAGSWNGFSGVQTMMKKVTIIDHIWTVAGSWNGFSRVSRIIQKGTIIDHIRTVIRSWNGFSGVFKWWKRSQL